MDFKRWIDALLGSGCAACGARLEVGLSRPLCAVCGPTALSGPGLCVIALGGASVPLGASWAYGGAVAEAITSMKFRRQPPRIDWLVAELARLCGALDLPEGAALVAVPPQRARLIERGFHLPDLAVALLARQTGMAQLWALTRTDAHLPRAVCPDSRPRFQARQRGGGRSVVLVDDVVTTGTTLGAAHAVLCAAGFVVGGALCLADAGVATRGQ